MRITRKAFVALGAVAALGIGAAFATGVGRSADSSPQPSPGDAYATEVAHQRAQLTPDRQAPFLARFNLGAKDASSLPVVVFDTMAWIGPLDSACLQARASAVGTLRVTNVSYTTSAMGDLPETDVTYAVVQGARGLTAGQQIVARGVGGPYLELNGKEEFVLLQYSYEQQVGDRVVAFLSKNPDGTFVPPCPGWSTFKLNADGTVADQPGATEAGVAGKAAAAVLSAYAAAN